MTKTGISNYQLAKLAEQNGVNLKLENIIMSDELTKMKLKKNNEFNYKFTVN